MDILCAEVTHEPDEQEGKDEGDTVINREANAAPGDTLGISLRARSAAEDTVGDAGAKVNPHREESQPSEELDGGELPHRFRHRKEPREDFRKRVEDSCGFAAFFAKGIDVFRRVFFGSDDGVKDCEEEDCGTDIEREFDDTGDTRRGGGGLDVEPVRENPRESRGDDGTEADEEALGGEAQGVLFHGEFIGDKGAEGFHAEIDGGIENPEEADGHPECRRVWHENQSGGGGEGTAEKKRATATEAAPSPVAVIADDRLEDETGEGSCEPEEGEFVFFRTEVLVDRTHVCHLEGPTELDAEEAEAHVPDSEKT